MTTVPPAGVPAEAAELLGWNDTQAVLMQRIARGIEYCQSYQGDDDAKDLLCAIMLTYEERFGPLSQTLHTRVERLFCTTKEAT